MNILRIVLGIGLFGIVAFAAPISFSITIAQPMDVQFTPGVSGGYGYFVYRFSPDGQLLTTRSDEHHEINADIGLGTEAAVRATMRAGHSAGKILLLAGGLVTTFYFRHYTNAKSLHSNNLQEAIMNTEPTAPEPLTLSGATTNDVCRLKSPSLSDDDTLLLVRALRTEAAHDENSTLALDQGLISLEAELAANLAAEDITGELVTVFDVAKPDATVFYETFGTWANKARSGKESA
jgi:hypothetical protein